ncbi:BREX-1 system adenine-specific DNA-methyltransferase PglX [Bifidobacterium boum]|uniref:BREX-1 system adenine-specific DNA-methyltransferase PglX n=1 Tax=Bifidobacterium boum TaxID=78343 RepID=UPI002E1B9146|nr:BREX-1 system adenine-specific DNA-methyltransferase PglX [Bifidobacterium boum]
MNTAKLQAFAQDARRQLMNAVSAQLDATLAENSRARTDEPGAVRFLEKTIEDETRKSGSRDAARQALIEQYAYRWFNRIIALRYMDVHGFTNIHVVSPADLTSSTALPEILAAAKRGEYDEDALALPGGEEIHDQVEALFNGTVQVPDPQGKAYGLLLLAECRYWHGVMPFMFEGAGDSARSYQADELLMPPDLLATGSVLRNAVVAMTPEDCGANVDGGFASGDSGNVEIIGWLYQFYISERKDEVMAGFKKNHKASSEEIPAATQLFTPDWIVRYLVQNTVGKLWTQSHPESQLHKSWEYYIEPDAGDTAQAEADDDHLVITTPQELTVCDPACGSGHMLTYAFDLLYQIYLEQGYTPSEIPGLILENNLYGMEIDERAASLAQFALMMKARAHDRRYFSHVVFPHICVVEPVEFNGTEVDMLNDAYGVDFDDETWNTYRHADVAGSLIQPSDELVNLSKTITDDALQGDPILDDRAAKVFRQSRYLDAQYAAVVANPPYMGSKNMGAQLKAFVQDHFKDGKADLFAAFMLRTCELIRSHGYWGMINLPSWVSLSSFDSLRKKLLSTQYLFSFIDLGRGIFGSDFGTVAFVFHDAIPNGAVGCYRRLFDHHVDVRPVEKIRQLFLDKTYHSYEVDQREFAQIPGSPIVYWLPQSLMETFSTGKQLKDVAEPKQGLATADNNRFLREWWEVTDSTIKFDCPDRDTAQASGKKWFPYNKGGEFRKWYGNQDYVLNWENDGKELFDFKPRSVIRNPRYYFKPSVSWSKISSGDPAFRYFPAGFVFDVSGTSCFCDESNRWNLLSFVNSSLAYSQLTAIAPTLNFEVGQIATLPIRKVNSEEVNPIINALISTSKSDWDSYETSWDFTRFPLLDPEQSGDPNGFVETAVKNLYAHWCEVSEQQRERETRNNELVADAYGVRHDVPCEVPLERVSLKRNAAFVYPDKTPEERAQLFARDVVKELISYAVGCMFGRYSLNKPGLILASQGQTLDDYYAQVPNPSFAPDADNVIPVTEVDCFDDDIVARFRAFLKAAFGASTLNANIAYIEQTLGKDLRRYFVTDFYDDHVKTYASRPIYWEYSSRTNNRGAFKALVYLHRYTPSTTSTVLGYLRDFTTKIMGIADALEKSDRTADHREADKLRKAAAECRDYEDKTLYPLATRNLPIDLDDGVLVNYLRMGDALRAIPSISKKRKDVEGWTWPVHPLKESDGEESDNR